MDDNYSKSFTELGVKYIKKFFMVNILLILLLYMLLVYTLAVFSYTFSNFYISMATGFAIFAGNVIIVFFFVLFSSLLAFSGTSRYYVIGIVVTLFVFCFIPFLGAFSYFALFYFIVLILLFLLIYGIINLFLGRKDFSKKHQIFVIVGFILMIFYFIFYLINIFLAGLQVNVLISDHIYSNIDYIFENIFLIFIFYILSLIFSNLAYFLFIYNISKKKTLLIVALILGLLSPFTFSISGIFSLILFTICYMRVSGDLEVETVKPTLRVPCPFCNKDIPQESKFCPYCKTVFKKRGFKDDEVF